MGAFEYVALDTSGKERKGLIEGDTAKHVRQLLRDKQLLPIEILEAAQREQKQNRSRRPFMRRGLSSLDLALLTRQLATLLRSGLPLEETLQAVAEQTEKARVQRIILGVRSKVVEGHPLADGLRDFPQAFPEIYRATVSAGEQSGKLDSVLERLADYTESRQVMGQLRAHTDAVSAHLDGGQRQHLVGGSAQVHGFPRRVVLVEEPTQPRDHVRRAIAVSDGAPGGLAGALDVGRLRGQDAQARVGVDENARQGLIHFMNDRGRQHAEARHARDMSQLPASLEQLVLQHLDPLQRECVPGVVQDMEIERASVLRQGMTLLDSCRDRVCIDHE